MIAWFAILGSALGHEDAPALPEDEIQRLIHLARDGDRVAAQRLYQQFVNRVFRSVRPMFLHESDAEDVTQDAMIAALGSLDRYRPKEGTRFVSWLLTVATNTARRRFRRKRPMPTDPVELAAMQREIDEAPAPDEEPDRAKKRAALLAALWELPEQDRRILSLRYGAELNATEVAAATGVGAANVRKICERGRNRLYEKLAPVFGEPEES